MKLIMNPTLRPRIRNEFMDTQIRYSNKINDLTIGTWNIRTILQADKMNEIAAELSRYRLDIVALQELRWKDAGAIVKKDYTLYYSGTPKKSGQKNTGFWINRNIKDKILGFESINERICKLRVRGKFKNLSLICIYALTEANEEIKIDLFYDILENVCNRVNKYDSLIILGDCNARIGKERLSAQLLADFLYIMKHQQMD